MMSFFSKYNYYAVHLISVNLLYVKEDCLYDNTIFLSKLKQCRVDYLYFSQGSTQVPYCCVLFLIVN